MILGIARVSAATLEQLTGMTAHVRRWIGNTVGGKTAG
jgi:hypothetical protein